MIPAAVELATPRGPIPARGASVGQPVLTLAGDSVPVREPIARLRFRKARGPLVRLVTASGRETLLTPDHRTYARLAPTEDFYDVLLVGRRGLGFVLGLTNGQLRDLRESTVLYEHGREIGGTHEENIWVLASVRGHPAATYVEHLHALRHGLPVFDFDARLRRSNISETLLVKVLAAVDTAPRAARLLLEHSMDPALPHFRRRRLTPSYSPDHRYVEATYHAPVAAHPGRPGGSAPAQARASHVARIIPLAAQLLFERDRIHHLDGAGVQMHAFARPQELDSFLASHEGQPLTDTCRRLAIGPALRYFVWPAAYLRPGMVVPVLDGGRIDEEPLSRVEVSEGEEEVFEPGLVEGCSLFAGGIAIGTESEVATASRRLSE